MSHHKKVIPISSPAFGDGGGIPVQYTADGRNDSPPLEWGDPPAETRSFALVCDDPDAPRGTFTHWVVWNLPADCRRLGSGQPPAGSMDGGARQGKNGFGRLGYGGPAPPPGPQHRYLFKLYALNTVLGLDGGASKENLLEAIRNHVIGEGILTGMYGRKTDGQAGH
jgi:Raf kinase inhibitor-like YbhB/YbcL family protein